MHFFYDAQSRPALVECNGNLYSYAHNLQGDIVGIVDSSGNLVVEYKYDAWGKPVVVRTLTTAYEALAELNPFRYREYVWDEEVECYYLRSRYYHPNRHRFINPDKYLPTEIFLCNNTFLYCSNQPTNCRDSDGCVPTDAEFHLRVQTAIITDAINGTSMFYEVPVVDSEGNTGRIDLFNRTTGEIWEVKKVTRPYSEAYDQLGGYLDMKIKDYNYDVIFKRGGPIAPGTTYLESSDGTKYAISYWYAGEGVIFYDVTIPEEQNRSIVDENSAGARIRRQNLLTKPDMTPDNTYIGLGLFGILAFALTGPALAGFASVTSSAAVIYLFPQILDKAA